MKYTLNTTNYHDFQVISDHQLPHRSYFIPFRNKQEEEKSSILNKRYQSSLVSPLNGVWDFKYYDNPNDLNVQLDTAEIDFSPLPVPSCWQFNGYGAPVYLNTRYPFPYHPPIIPTTNSVTSYWSVFDGRKTAPAGEYNHVGLYRTFLPIKDMSKRYVISFLGVISCLDVYVNGNYVGYSESFHNTAEFDLTEYLKSDDNNELLCVVRRWCNGSYLECQDMFRNNGIFRDVLLREEDASSILDLNFTPIKKGNFYVGSVDIKTYSDIPVTISLSGHGTSLLKEITTYHGEGHVSFEMENALEWNAEYPNLYDLVISTSGQYIHQRVGFKDIRIQGDTYLFNGTPVKFHGVNHHDTSPTAGYYLTPQEIERDLNLCKSFNIDTVRTSHYAPDPLLLELAAELGLYVVDEVDLETHGAQVNRFPPDINAISNDAKWKNHYMERTVAHYQRDKLLDTPVILWSLGNESGAGCNTDSTFAYFKQNSAIPVQYESAVHNKAIIAYDVVSEMYPAAAKVASVGAKTITKDKYTDRPYFLCEYAHAMGVGPGNIEDYWDAIYRYSSLMGGCVWELVDHAVLEADGTYTYGGDHGEWIHDGNFCCDGLFYPDRSPSTGAYIVKHCYTPLRIRQIGNKLSIFNTTGFSSGDCFTLRLHYSNGKEATYTPHCAPLCSEIANINIAPTDSGSLLNIEIIDLRTGTIRDETQLILQEFSLPAPTSQTALPSWFSCPNGLPVFTAGGNSISAAEEYTLLYRAATDNDVKLMMMHPMNTWYKQKETVYDVKQTGNCIYVKSKIIAGRNRFSITDTYEGFNDSVLVTSKIHCTAGLGMLPRFAKVFRLPSSFNSCHWFGQRDETYIDMKNHSVIGEFTQSVEQMHEPNIRPQESGNRMDTTFAEISDGKNIFRIEAVNRPFELNIKPYSDRELISMRHRSDEKTTGTYIAINAFQQGIGTGSCGPYTLKRHCYSMNQDYTLQFLIRVK